MLDIEIKIPRHVTLFGLLGLALVGGFYYSSMTVRGEGDAFVRWIVAALSGVALLGAMVVFCTPYLGRIRWHRWQTRGQVLMVCAALGLVYALFFMDTTVEDTTSIVGWVHDSKGHAVPVHPRIYNVGLMHQQTLYLAVSLFGVVVGLGFYAFGVYSDSHGPAQPSNAPKPGPPPLAGSQPAQQVTAPPPLPTTQQPAPPPPPSGHDWLDDLR